MEKEKFKLCDDLQSIFKDAVELTKRYGYKEISYETIFYCILKRYIEDKEGKDEVLNDLFSNYEEIDKEKILEISKELMEDNFTSFSNPLPSTYSTAKFRLNPIISSQMNDVLIRAKKECDEFFGTDTIQTSNFYLSLMKENDQIIEYMAEEADMSCEELVKLLYKKSRDPKVVEEEDKETIGGEFKEKTIDTPNAVKGDDKEDKQPTPEEMDKMDKDDEEFEEAGKVFENAGFNEEEINRDPNSKTPYLDKYADNMIEEAKKGLYDPTIGRDDIIEQIIEVLSCRKKSNLILLADEGVGKDQCIQELARRIAKGNVPKSMKKKIIYSLNFNKLLINSSLRGQTETRIQGIVDEACKDRNIIIYLPEIHNIIGLNSNGGGGAGDIANVLKPYLTGKISIIGSTTFKEFSVIEKDGAFKRRFQTITLKEPSVDETIEILEGIKSKYSEFHHVKYSKEIIEYCVKLSDRYISERFFPDKAVDVIDMSGALASLRNSSDEPDELSTTKKNLSQVIERKIKAVRSQDFEEAAKIKEEEKKLRKIIEDFQKIEDKKEKNPKNWSDVTKEDIAKVVSKISNIPVDKLGRSEMEKIIKLDETLRATVIGQDEGISEIIKTLQRNALNLRDPKKPIASILLVASTATGKTWTARTIAKEYFGSEKNMIRLDMNEFKDDGSVKKLLGSEPSFIGYESYRPELDKIRTNPHTIVLCDEIEKASKSVIDLFLGVLDEGHIKLNNGVDVDFKNTIILFTSNLGTKEIIDKGEGLGFSKLSGKAKEKEDRSIAMKSIKKFFRPELLNRMSNIIFYRNLEDKDFKKILEIELNKLSDRIKETGPRLKVSNSLKDKIIKEIDRNYNVRSLQRNVVKYLENEICEAILVNKITNLKEVSTISADYKDDKIIISFIKKSEKKKKKEIIETKTTESQPVE